MQPWNLDHGIESLSPGDTERRDRHGAGRRRYPSDLSERQWRAIEPLLREPSRRKTCPTAPLRDVANAVNYRWRSGCSWRMLPHDFPPWTTVYTHFREWRRRGVLTEIRAALLSPRRSDLVAQGVRVAGVVSPADGS